MCKGIFSSTENKSHSQRNSLLKKIKKKGERLLDGSRYYKNIIKQDFRTSLVQKRIGLYPLEMKKNEISLWQTKGH